MRAVNRDIFAAPESLEGKDSKASKELVKYRKYIAKRLKAKPDFMAYKSSDVRARLDEMFHGKCAYCESVYASTAPMDVEHFRPKGAVSESKQHSGYWWLAMQWENLLPSCIDCNRFRTQEQMVGPFAQRAKFDLPKSSGKRDSFPILGVRATGEESLISEELPLLLDPCRDNPEGHLTFVADRGPLISLVVARHTDDQGAFDVDACEASEGLKGWLKQAASKGLSLKATASILVYGLNRVRLVQERTRVLRCLEFLGDIVLEIGTMIQDLELEFSKSCEYASKKEAVVRRLKFLQEKILGEMKAMTLPEAPYSAMASAWLLEYKRQLMSGCVDASEN